MFCQTNNKTNRFSNHGIVQVETYLCDDEVAATTTGLGGGGGREYSSTKTVVESRAGNFAFMAAYKIGVAK